MVTKLEILINLSFSINKKPCVSKLEIQPPFLKSSKPRGPCEVPPRRNITKKGPSSSLCSPMKGNQKVAKIIATAVFLSVENYLDNSTYSPWKMNGWNLNINKFKRKVIIKTCNLGSMLIFQGVFTHEKTTSHPVTAVFELPIVHILLQGAGLRVGLPTVRFTLRTYSRHIPK